MTRSEINEKVQTIFRRVFSDDSIVINDAMVAADVDDWDSLNHSIMIAEVEEAFNVKFGIREILRMENVGDMINLLEERAN